MYAQPDGRPLLGNGGMMQVIKPDKGLIKAWIDGVPLEDAAEQQLKNVAAMPFIYKWLAVMPDVHWGMGATVGSVIPTLRAIIPAAVGVDLGCGMNAVKLDLKAENLPENLSALRAAIERAVPHGRTSGGPNDKGSWRGKYNKEVPKSWDSIRSGYNRIVDAHPKISGAKTYEHLGTLGTGNHFIELCLDENDFVWIMLHSGSRGIGNRIGSYFIKLAKQEMERWHIHLPDKDLAYLPQGSQYFGDYVEAVNWAQQFARLNREIMMSAVIIAISTHLPPFKATDMAVNCHHNYIRMEHHYGQNVWVTRKGAVSAKEGELGIIPGSMGTRSYIVRGKGNPESFSSCSHGAGRTMSRRQAREKFSLDDHKKATEGVECRKDEGVLDETPAAYKDIDAVMAAQSDLVETVAILKQILCVKG